MALPPKPVIKTLELRGSWDDVEHPINVEISLEVEATADSSMILLTHTHPALERWHSIEFVDPETPVEFDEPGPSEDAASVRRYNNEEIHLHEKSPTEISMNPLRDPKASEEDGFLPLFETARRQTLPCQPKKLEDSTDRKSGDSPHSHSPRKGDRPSSPQKRPVSITQRPPWGSPVVEIAKKRGRLEAKRNKLGRRISISQSVQGRESPQSIMNELSPSKVQKSSRKSMIPRRRLRPSRSLGNLRSTEPSPDGRCGGRHRVSQLSQLPLPEFKRPANEAQQNGLVSESKVHMWLGDSTGDWETDSIIPSKSTKSSSTEGSDNMSAGSIMETAQNRNIGAPQDLNVIMTSSSISLAASPSPSSQAAIPWTAVVPGRMKHRNMGLLRGGGVIGDISSSFYCVDDGNCLQAKFTEQCLVFITITANIIPQTHPKGGYLLEIPGLSLPKGVRVTVSMVGMKHCNVLEDNCPGDRPSLRLQLLPTQETYVLDTEQFEIDYSTRVVYEPESGPNSLLRVFYSVICSLRLQDVLLNVENVEFKLFLRGRPAKAVFIIKLESGKRTVILENVEDDDSTLTGTLRFAENVEIKLKSRADELLKPFTICFIDKIDLGKGAVHAWAPSVGKMGCFRSIEDAREISEVSPSKIRVLKNTLKAKTCEADSCDKASSPIGSVRFEEDIYDMASPPVGFVENKAAGSDFIYGEAISEVTPADGTKQSSPGTRILLTTLKYALLVWLTLHAFFPGTISAAENKLQQRVAKLPSQLVEAMRVEPVASWDDITGWRSLRKQYKQRTVQKVFEGSLQDDPEIRDESGTPDETQGEPDILGEQQVEEDADGTSEESSKEQSAHPESLRDFVDYLLGYRGPDGSWGTYGN